MTGLELDEQRIAHVLGSNAWRKKRDILRKKGGAPELDSSSLLDPILYGKDPTARAKAWVERQRWEEAEAAFDQAVRARPHRPSVWKERGLFFVQRSKPEKAAASFYRALVMGASEFEFQDEIASNGEVFDHFLRMVSPKALVLPISVLVRRAENLAREGRFDTARELINLAVSLGREKGGLFNNSYLSQTFAALGCWGQIAKEAASFQETTNLYIANRVAWNCALAPFEVIDPEIPVKLAERAVKGTDAWYSDVALNTLGAVLYRVGRFEDAIRRLEEAIKSRNGAEAPLAWPFLAMAHHRLGHREEARRWLDRFQGYEPSKDHNRFWTEMQIRMLRSEAEAVILYDPIFPANPFMN